MYRQKQMGDWELFRALCDAEEHYEELRAEFLRRGLDRKPFIRYDTHDDRSDETEEE